MTVEEYNKCVGLYSDGIFRFILKNIKDEDIIGDTEIIAAVMLNPFMGASGGQENYWDSEDEKYNIEVPKEMTEGYVMVPDGPGTLIRFNDYTTSLIHYVGDVYGYDYSQLTYNQFYNGFGAVDYKSPAMPVYGISVGDSQAAFVGYALEGEEYMEIIVTPEENMTFYTWAYPKFVYNRQYYQVYNRSGAGFYTLFDERNHFDLHMRYEFLNNEEYSADYVGMALAYRDHLLDTDQIKIVEKVEDTPIRIDFMMNDSEFGVLGLKNVYETTVEEVDVMLEQLYNNGVTEISVGLYGWQDGGASVQKPSKVDWHRKIGTKGDFEDLFSKYTKLGVDISLVTDYVNVNEEQIFITSNVSKHVNGQYNESIFPMEPYIDEYYFASPNKSENWALKQLGKLDDIGMNSFTIEGLGHLLFSDYRSDLTVTDSMALYENIVNEFSEEFEVNIDRPNQYLWKYTDRFLNAPLFGTQHLIETDTVPFLQIVLNNTMDMFSEYVNFSLSTDDDLLRMIDYNVTPSFILTKQPSSILTTTNSSVLYSTEFHNYEDKIYDTYEQVNEILNQVNGSSWIDRDVAAPGIIVNSYDNGKVIVINYSESDFVYNGVTIKSESAQVLS